MAHSRIGESTFEVILNIVRRRKWAGLTVFVATLSLAVPFALFLPNVYRAAATVIVENGDEPVNFARPGMELETRLGTIQQEILSRARLQDLIARLNLYPTQRGKVPLDALVGRLRRDIQVELTGTDQGRKNPLIAGTTIGVKVSYVALDPQTAALVPNALASMYVDENTKMRQRQTGQMADFLKGQLAAAQSELARQQERLNEFKAPLAGELPQQVSVNLATLERLNTQLRLNSENQMRLRELIDRDQQQLSERDPKAVLAGADSRDQLAVLNQRLIELRSKFTDAHPDVIQTEAQISELEQQRALDPSAKRLRETVGAAKAELARLAAEERSLQSETATYDQRVRVAPRHEEELQALTRDSDVANRSVDTLRARYEEAQLAESLEQKKKGETFRILDPALVPLGPAAPNRMWLLLVAGIFAVGTAIGAILLIEHLDTSFHSVGELRQFTSLPVLATIPHLEVRESLAARALRAMVFVGAVLAVCALLAGFGYKAARGNIQLVWMLSGSKL
jgi:succinoglycan biosynthesis transport protein ExoP